MRSFAFLRIPATLRGLASTQLGRNTLWGTLGLGSRILIQALYFVIIARKLGTENYGTFVGVVAIACFLAPFSGWGSGVLLVKYVARDRGAFPTYWGAALATTGTVGLALLAVAVCLSEVIFGARISIWIPVLVCLSDLLFARLADLAVFAFLSVEKLRVAALVQVLFSVLRLIAAVTLLLFFATPSSAEHWAFLYAASSGVAAVVCLCLVRIEIGWGPLSLQPMKGKVREGFYFAVGSAAQGLCNDIDKTIVARLDSLSAAGFYAAAYRVQEATLVPLRALVQASYARFFRAGMTGVGDSMLLARRLLPWALAFGFGASIFLVLISPLLPVLLGPGYQDAVTALRWIAALPVFRCAGYLAAQALTGADKQRARSMFQVGLTLLNLGLNLALIPRFGWVAAAWASLVSEGLSAVALWGLVYWFVRRGRSTGAVPPDVPRAGSGQ